MTYRSLRKNIFIVPGSPITLITKFDDCNWMIDPGMGGDRVNSLSNVLDRVNIRDYNILVSHTHYDHVETLTYFSGREIYVNEFEYSQLINPTVREQATYGFNPLPRLLGLQQRLIPSYNVKTFSLANAGSLSSLKLLDLSGHSPGLTGVILDDVVFVGDALFGDVLLKRVGIPYHSDVFKSLRVLDDTLRVLSDKGFEAVLSHGPVIKNQKFGELIEFNIRRIKQVIELLTNELDVGGTIEELTIKVLKSLGAEISASSVYLGSVTTSSIVSKLFQDGRLDHVVCDVGVKWKLKRY
ncbi:MAG: MBL fold metallo-hydrolase [Sulfolobales archaeon]|nr:MBL fold metallo-hydrolase [Sulfolobales archaeon]